MSDLSLYSNCAQDIISTVMMPYWQACLRVIFSECGSTEKPLINTSNSQINKIGEMLTQ